MAKFNPPRFGKDDKLLTKAGIKAREAQRKAMSRRLIRLTAHKGSGGSRRR